MNEKKKFVFEKDIDYGDRGPIFYKTDEIKIDTLAFHQSSLPYIQGKYELRVNGPKTAYATLNIVHKHYSNYEFGFSLTKHFEGSHAGQKARAWLNNMSNNCPDYHFEIRRNLK